jgi:hypothetical protein
MASAVVTSDPEPEKLARTKAAAHTVVDRGMLRIIWKHCWDYIMLGDNEAASRVASLCASDMVMQSGCGTYGQDRFKRMYLTNVKGG